LTKAKRQEEKGRSGWVALPGEEVVPDISTKDFPPPKSEDPIKGHDMPQLESFNLGTIKVDSAIKPSVGIS